ncbi:MAG: hypothetical protein ACRC42_00415, partial [Mycoplasma sp.]
MNNKMYTGHCDFSPLAGNCKISAGFFQGTNDTTIKLIPLRDSRVVKLSKDDTCIVYVFKDDIRIFEEDKEKQEVSFINDDGMIIIHPFEEFTEYDGQNILMIEIISKGMITRSNEIHYTVAKNKTYVSKG